MPSGITADRSETVEARILALAEKADVNADTFDGRQTPKIEALHAACDPDTIQKLCRVVEGSRPFYEQAAWSLDYHQRDGVDYPGYIWIEEDDLRKLVDAIRALDGADHE